MAGKLKYNPLVKKGFDNSPKYDGGAAGTCVLWLPTVADIRLLTVYLDKSSIGNYSNNASYVYDAASVLADDGYTVIKPAAVVGNGAFILRGHFAQVNIIHDLDEDSYIDLEGVGDQDKATMRINQTGANSMFELLNAGGGKFFDFLADGTFKCKILTHVQPGYNLELGTSILTKGYNLYGLDGNTKIIIGYTTNDILVSAFDKIFFAKGGVLKAEFNNTSFGTVGFGGTRYWLNLMYSNGLTSGLITDIIKPVAKLSAGTGVALHIEGGEAVTISKGGAVLIDGGATPAGEAGDVWLASTRGRVAVGHTSTTEQLDIVNTTKLQGIRREIITITAAIHTCSKSEHILEIDANANTIQIELLEPSTSNKGQEFVIDVYNADNTIRLLAFSKTLLDVDTITDEGGNTFRYTMNGTPDLSAVIIGDRIKTASATNAANDGIWLVTAVNDGADWIEVTNAAGVAEATDSPCTLQLNVLDDATMVLNETRTYLAYSHRDYYRRIN